MSAEKYYAMCVCAIGEVVEIETADGTSHHAVMKMSTETTCICVQSIH